MKTLIALAAILLAASAAADTFVHVSCGKNSEIRTYRIDPDTKKLVELGSTETNGPRMQWKHPRLPLLFVATGGDTVSTFEINAESQLPEFRSSTPTAGSPSYLCTDPPGKFLFSASYRTGEVAFYPLAKGGKVGNAVQVLEQPVKSHCILTDPSGKFVFVPHTMPVNRVDQFKFDPGAKKLTPNDPPHTSPPIDTGPRHLAISKDGRFVYTSNEQGISATLHHFDSKTGLLEEKQTVSAFQDGKPEIKMSCSDIELAPDERFLYLANRDKTEGGLSSITCYGVNPDDGRIQWLSRTTVDAVPRSFNITPGGRWMVVASQARNTLTLFAIDPLLGALIEKHKIETGGSPGWVLTRTEI